ncbi:hypothetical protein BDZ94DRAFT_1301106 [Collybia nuda]|uniref:Uncharacterized protein n=1 Tax=Collybia nuda TaxID=64659 RepID=A0A9P5XZP2_9AGAR|nr:hypothetical protein BDZ94DRAFT_1301106 [Collybia nuda]
MTLNIFSTEESGRTTWVGPTVIALTSQERIAHPSIESTLTNLQSDEYMLGRRETIDIEPSTNLSQNSLEAMSNINASSIPYILSEEGVHIILILMRRIQRTKFKVGELGARPPVSLESNTGGDAEISVSEPRKFDGSTSIRIRSLEEGMGDLVENFLSSISRADDHLRPAMSTTGPENHVGRNEGWENSSRRLSKTAAAHFERNSTLNPYISQSTPPQRPSIIIPGGMGWSSAPVAPNMIEGRLSSPKSNGREHWSAVSEFSPTPIEPVQTPRGHRISAESRMRYPETPVSGYPASMYPVSTLPGYPDSLRTTTPPPYYHDLSRTHTLRSARSFRSAYDPAHWSRGNIPSLPLPCVP